MDIRVDVVNQRLQTATNLKSFIAGTQEFIRFVFNLDGDWDDLLVFAQFTQNGVSYNQYLDNENSAYLPSEIGVGICTLTLYGSYGNTRATTNYLTLTIEESKFVADANSTQLTYQQILTLQESYLKKSEFKDQTTYLFSQLTGSTYEVYYDDAWTSPLSEFTIDKDDYTPSANKKLFVWVNDRLLIPNIDYNLVEHEEYYQINKIGSDVPGMSITVQIWTLSSGSSNLAGLTSVVLPGLVNNSIQGEETTNND